MHYVHSVKGHSTSSEMTLFDRPDITCY